MCPRQVSSTTTTARPRERRNRLLHQFFETTRVCLDHILSLSERQLHRVSGEYVEYFNHARPHQGLGQRIPDPLPEKDVGQDTEETQQVIEYPVLGGLHHDYRRAA